MQNLEIKGLDPKEFETYKNLLQLKRATVLQLAKISGEKRTNLYRELESLIAKGLVSEVYEGKKHYFIAESPKKLVDFVNVEREKVKKLLPELESLENRALDRPKIKFYEGKEALKNLYDAIYQEKGEIMAIGSPDRLVEDIDFHNAQVAKRVRLSIPARVIYSDSAFARKRSKIDMLRQVKITKKLRPLDATYMMSGNKLVAFSHKNWVTGVLIENKEIVSGLKAVFDALWEEIK